MGVVVGSVVGMVVGAVVGAVVGVVVGVAMELPRHPPLQQVGGGYLIVKVRGKLTRCEADKLEVV